MRCSRKPSVRLALIAAAFTVWLPNRAAGQSIAPPRPSSASPRTSQQVDGDRRPYPPGRTLWDHRDEPGSWIPWEVSCSSVEAATQQAWEKQLQTIAAMIRALPVFQEIRGYYPMITGCVQRSGIASDPYSASLALLIWPPVTVERNAAGQPRVRSYWRHNGLGGLWINFNSFEDLTHDWPSHDDKDGRFFELPEARESIQGFPVLGKIVYVGLAGKPPLYVPITQERALRWIIDHLKRQIGADTAGLAASRRSYEEFVSPAGKARRAKAIEEAAASQRKPENQALARRQAEAIDRRREKDLQDALAPKPGSPQALTMQRAAQLEARLSAMTPEERRAPAWYRRLPGVERWPDYGEIVPADTSGARPLVVANEAYFNRSLPKTAIQLVRTRLMAGCVEGEADAAIQSVCRSVVEQLDWKAIQAMLRK